MPRKKHSELAAGLFVVVGLVVLLGVVLWLGAADMLRTRGRLVTFCVAMDEGSLGIAEGADVTVGDARVGRVVEVSADPAGGKCFYAARLERGDVVVRSDADAEAISPMVGQTRIVLRSLGTERFPPADAEHPVTLKAGGFAQTLRGVSQFTEGLEAQLDANRPGSLMGKIHGVATDVGDAARELAITVSAVRGEFRRDDRDSLLGKIHQGITDLALAAEQIRGQMNADEPNAVLGAVRRAAVNVAEQTDPGRKGSIFALLRDGVAQAETLLRNGRPIVESILMHLDGTAEHVERLSRNELTEVLRGLCEAKTMVLRTLDDINDASRDVKEVVHLNRDNLDEIIDNLTQTSATLKATAREVRRSPWLLLHEPTEKEFANRNLYDAASAFSAGAGELDQAVAKLRLLQKMRLDQDPAARATAEKVLKALEKSFEKFDQAEKAFWEQLKAAGK